MSDAIGLVRAVLGSLVNNDDEARVALEAALLRESDPLHYFACHHVASEQAYERAAHYFGMAFAPFVPRDCKPHTKPQYLDKLSHLRTMRGHLLGREILFVAPSFENMLAVGKYVRTHPDMFNQICIVPPSAIRDAVQMRFSPDMLAASRQRLMRKWPLAASHLELSLVYRIGFVVFLMIATLGAAIAPFWLELGLIPFMVLILLLPSWFRLTAIFDRKAATPAFSPDLLEDAALPIYSVLVPLRDEANMVEQLARAFRALDYPAEKLDIIFVVEQASLPTIAAVRQELGTTQFSLVISPNARPHTKPKALNYAMPLVRGEHVVVFDAEDIPHPQQLRLAATRFAHQPDVDCLQAELVIDNAEENWLTANFTAEYAGLFGIMLPMLAKWQFPLPLGGTSNHFRTRALRNIGGWDAFNVTEDADLGIRLARSGMKTGMLASHTLEESPIALSSWLKQRTRWMKGWMQTYLVHSRRPLHLARTIGWRNFCAFQIYIGGLIVSPLLHTIFLIALGARLALDPQSFLFAPTGIHLFQLFILVSGYTSAVLVSIAGLARNRRMDLLKYQLYVPLYWVMIGLATALAARELLFKPHFWAKTSHGQSRRRSMQPHPLAPQQASPDP